MSQEFASILEQHAELDELFLCHQEALIALDGQVSALLLRVYREFLAVHMGFEDSVLIPLYGTLGPSERAPVVLYTGQHRKLSLLLDRAEALVDTLGASPAPSRRQVLEILDLESTIKHLSEHHHAAESQALFPTLDQHVSGASREQLVAEGWALWNAKRSERASTIMNARAELERR